jgi:hypothetical protein
VATQYNTPTINRLPRQGKTVSSIEDRHSDRLTGHQIAHQIDDGMGIAKSYGHDTVFATTYRHNHYDH